MTYLKHFMYLHLIAMEATTSQNNIIDIKFYCYPPKIRLKQLFWTEKMQKDLITLSVWPTFSPLLHTLADVIVRLVVSSSGRPHDCRDNHPEIFKIPSHTIPMIHLLHNQTFPSTPISSPISKPFAIKYHLS